PPRSRRRGTGTAPCSHGASTCHRSRRRRWWPSAKGETSWPRRICRVVPLQPAAGLEFPVEQDARQDDESDDDEVAVFGSQLGHVLEVHAVDARDEGRYGGDGDPGPDLAHVVVLADGDLGLVGVERRHQQRLERPDLLDDPDEVVAHVTEERGDVRVDPAFAHGSGELVQRASQGADGYHEVEYFTDQEVDALR